MSVCLQLVMDFDSEWSPPFNEETSLRQYQGAQFQLSGIQKVQGLPSSALPISPEEQELGDGQDQSEADLKRQFMSSSLSHIEILLRQILEKDNLDAAWFDIILSMAQRICKEVKVDVQAKDLMDIRQYVHIKKLPGGSRQECQIIHGTVCTKNVTNKKMLNDLSHPRILLLGTAVEHQRVENKFVSLEPVVLQEREFLKNCVSKLIAKKPDVLIVEKTVARVAQEFLLAHGITLMSNTKPLVLARIRRCTGASLEELIEQAAQATLGTCHRLHLKVYQLPGGYSKTLMFVEGCPPRLGCSVLLRGDSLSELRKVKQCLQYMVCAVYHAQLEAAYLFDSFALPIKGNQEILPSSLDDSFHGGLSTSFSDGMHHQDLGGKSAKNDNSGENQDKSVKYSIKSAMQKLMKGQEGKKNIQDKGEDAGIAVDPSGKPGDGSYEHVDNASQQSAKASQEVDDTQVVGAVTSSVPMSVPMSGFQKVEKEAVAQGEGEILPASGYKDQEIDQTLDDKSSQEGDKYSVSPGIELFEVESKIIPFTALLTTGGEPVVNSFTLATPIKLSPFQRALKEVKISSSPHLLEEPPYLETERGRLSSSMQFLRDKIYSSPRLLTREESSRDESETETVEDKIVPADNGETICKREIELDQQFYHSLDRCTKPSKEVYFTKPHPFLDFHHLADGEQVSSLVADFRARGGRLVPRPQRHYRSAETVQNSYGGEESEEPLTESQTLPSRFRNAPMGEGGSSNGPMREGDSITGPIRDEAVMDCLDPYNHQSLVMQFSSFSLFSDNAPNYCIHPRTIQMEFYGKNDVTLGHFLDKFCFNTRYTCRSRNCEALMLQHIRRFVHGEGCMEVILRVLDEPVVDGIDDIIVWNWCRRCSERLPYQTFSKEAWQMSFSKFMELRFHARDYTSRVNMAKCGHSLHRNHNQYFSRGKIVATIKYHTIKVCEVVFPPPVLPEHKPFVMFPDTEKELANINNKGTELLMSICTNITNLTNTMESCLYLEDKRAEFSGMYEDHQMLFKKHLIGLQDKVQELQSFEGDQSREREDKVIQLQDAFVSARRALAQIAMAWDMRFEEFLYEEKERKRREQTRGKKGGEDDTTKFLSSFAEESESGTHSNQTPPCEGVRLPEVLSPDTTTPDVSFEESGELVTMVTRERTDTAVSALGEEALPSDPTDTQPPDCDDRQNTTDLQPERTTDSQLPESTDQQPTGTEGDTGDMLEPPLTRGSLSNSSSSLNDQSSIQQSSSSGLESQPAQRRKKGMFHNWISDKTAPVKIDMPFPPDQHYILPPCDIPSIVIFDKEPSSIIAYTLSSEKYKEDLRNLKFDRNLQMTNASSGRSSPAGSLKGTDRSTSNGEGARSKNPMLKKPKKMFNFIWSKGNSSPPPQAGSDETTDTDGEGETRSTGSTDVKDEADFEMSKTSKDSTSSSIVCEFTDPTHSQFWCRVYYPSEFARLRQTLFPSGEEVFLRCLSRCKSWKATGGKSGSKFSKTEDDRFVLKEIQRTESDFFLQFAPHYIKHMEDTLNNNHPTVLTKIFGFYTIVCKNPITNTATRQHIVVMENLFYKRQIIKVFDLKGSIRNRHVKTTSTSEEENHVLMDENLIKEMVKSPLYIRLHNKSILKHALDADTKLLARHFVMDYSLLVGIDRDEQELVIGIIDFIRKFTFDKKLEMIVKSSGIVGGHGKPPTILSPELYRTRFCEAMDKYFVLVPDRWTRLGRDYFDP